MPVGDSETDAAPFTKKQADDALVLCIQIYKIMSDNLKILILEDNLNDADLIIYELKKSSFIFTSEVVQTRETYENALSRFKPDIILSDYSLPSFDGVSAFNIKQSKYPDIPFIVISGTIGEENAVDLIKNGVTDYALKDKLFTLTPKITRALEEANAKQQKIRTTEKLRESETRFRHLMEAIPDALIGSNKEGNIVYANLQASILFGYTKDELLNTKVEILLPESFLNGHKVHSAANEAMQVSRKTAKDDIALFGVRKDGSEFAAEISLKSIEMDEGLVVLIVVRDITEKKKVEEERFRLSTILEATSDFVGIVDINQQIIYFNKAGRKRMGYSEMEDLSQTKITDYFPAWANEIIIKEGLAVALKTGKWMGETAFLTKEGMEIPVSQVIIVHKTPNGEFAYLSTIARDITFQKEMTKKLKIQNEKLYEIAFLQSHQVRGPIASILGLISLFNFDNPNDPINTIVITNLQKTTVAFDEIIHEIVQKTSEIEEIQ